MSKDLLEVIKSMKVHLWKSELSLILTALESHGKKTAFSESQEDMFNETVRKISKAYKDAQR